jgi:hypothetical protein
MFHFLPFLSPFFQQDSDVFGLIGGLCGGLIGLAFGIFMLIAMWKIFTKAGKPGWAAIIPIYNLWVMLEVVGRPGWWLLLMLIPGVNVVISIIVIVDLAKSFGKEGGFAIGLILLPYIFFPILGYGKAQYQGPAAA